MGWAPLGLPRILFLSLRAGRPLLVCSIALPDPISPHGTYQLEIRNYKRLLQKNLVTLQ